jgi:hypothetical protein
MHPAYSIILFTAASGAGYGLLAAAGVYAALGLMPADRGLGLLVLCPALALVTAGLLSSTAHLGRPDRAWRAFSQWRTSWLSREGVAALATYLAAAPFAAGWLIGGRTGGPTGLAGLLTGDPGGGDGRGDRDDLRLAQADRGVAQRLDRAGLLGAGGRDRAPVALGAREVGRPAAAGADAGRPRRGRRRPGAQEAYWRHIARTRPEHARERHRPRLARARCACSTRPTPRATTCCARWASGVRAPARGAAQEHRPRPRLRAPAGRVAPVALAEPGLASRRRWACWLPPVPRRGCWPSAGCSSPSEAHGDALLRIPGGLTPGLAGRPGQPPAKWRSEPSTERGCPSSTAA